MIRLTASNLCKAIVFAFAILVAYGFIEMIANMLRSTP